MLTAVQHQVRTLALRTTDPLRIGPFQLRLDPAWPTPAANYAIPDDGAKPTAAEIRSLTATFRERGLPPRLEFLPDCAPDVEPALRAAGFSVLNRRPLLACGPGDVRPVAAPDGDRVGAPEDERELREAAQVQHEAFGESGEVAPGMIAWLRRTGESGGRVGCAVIEAALEVVGAGVYAPPVGGVTELAGVAVAEPFRRRGIASALSAHLTAAALDGGAELIWLEPEDADVARIYARVGYRPLGEKLTLGLD
jgi:GNAT superfamily N-acetyltransferase